MTKNIFLLLFILFSALFFGQNFKTDVENQFRDYNSLISNKDFKKAMDLYANEDFFKIVPKEQLIEMMEMVMNAPEMEFKMYPPENIIIDEKNVVNENGKKYLKLIYNQRLDMKFKDSKVKPEDLLSALQGQFGYNQVRYNEKTDFFEINTIKSTVANSSDFKNWKFTVIEKKQIPILKQFIPEKFLKELN